MRNPTSNKCKIVIVLDTSAFVAGFNPFSTEEKQYTVPLVRDELIRDSMVSVRFKAALENRTLLIKTPDQAFEKKVRESAAFVGDRLNLSETDLQVLALALEFKAKGMQPLIVTDDYSIQNVANQLQIEFSSLTTFGIRFRLQWVRYCPACHRRYQADYRSKTCEVCGTQLKRKPLRKSHLNQTAGNGVTRGQDDGPKREEDSLL